MFKGNKKNNENDINAYIGFVVRIIRDPKLKEEIVEQIRLFENEGIIIIDGNNLSGKIINEDGNLYLDIKYENGKFICSYTKWDLDSIVLIEQESLKGGNYKLTKTDKVKYKTYNNENNYETEILEKIYNIDNKLLYESKSEIEERFDSFKEQLLYKDDSPFNNVVSIEKRWYMHNDSIIMYKMNKNELHTKKGIEESCLICKKPYKDEFATRLYFTSLDKELFISLMTGQSTIEEVLEKLNEKETVKSIGEKKD